MWCPESPFAATVQRLVALALVCAAALLAGCGSAPLGALTPTQRQQFDALNTAMLRVGDSTQTFDQLQAAADAAQATCNAADRSDPMIATFAAACAPTLKFIELASLLQTRCSVQDTACAHTLKHLSRNLTKLIALIPPSNAAIASEVKGKKCIATLSSAPDELSGYKAFAIDVDRMGDAVNAGDELGFVKAAAALEELSKDMSFSHPEGNASAAQQILDFHKACKVGGV